MKVEFRKVPFKEVEFEAKFQNLILKGVFYKEDPHLMKLKGSLNGLVEVPCIKCLNLFTREIDEKLNFILTDRVYNGFDDDYDVIEIINSEVDFDKIIDSEIESIKYDYNICPNCESSETDFVIE